MKKIKLYLLAFVVGSGVLSCDSDSDNFGVHLVDDGVEGVVNTYDLKVYNVDNKDATRADSYVLQKAMLGAFSEDKFGMQKSAYITQIRLYSYAPKFGTNPVVDSVVLEIKPEYANSAPKVSTSEVEYGGEKAKKTLTIHDVLKYGKEGATLTIKVNEVEEGIGKVGDEILSNKVVRVGRELGSKSFSGKVTSVNIARTSDSKVLLSRDANIRVDLDKNTFQEKILNKSNGAELATESAFIEYFKGLKIDISEEDGYLMTILPNNIELKMYYTSGEANDRKSEVYSFNLGANNAKFSQISYKRNNDYSSILNKSNKIDGDPLIYVQGMGGSGMGVKMSGSYIDQLRKLYQEKGTAILSAKIRLNIDISWKNTYAKPTEFLVKEIGSTDFITDLKTMFYNANYRLVKTYTIDNVPTHYDIDITKTIKDIVEQNKEPKDLVINVGEYIRMNGALVSEVLNTNAYSPYRVIFVGTDAKNAASAKLMVTHITK